MVHKSKDVVGGGSVKDKNGKVVVNEPDVLETWRQYHTQGLACMKPNSPKCAKYFQLAKKK